MNTVWVLTEEYNEYDQHGEYFVAWWPNKPTKEQLMQVGVEERRVDHVLNGGGRIVGPGSYYDNKWYNLKQKKAGGK